MEREDSKAGLMRAAKELFARNGLEGTTVRDIASKAGASLCLVSYHFGGKEGLYRACIEEFGKERLRVAREILEAPRSAEDLRLRLRLLLQSMFKTAAQEPELYRLVLRECEAGLPLAREIYEQTFLKLTNNLIEFFKAAQKKGLVRKDLDIHTLIVMIQGSVAHFLRIEAISRQYFDRSLTDPRQQEKTLESLLSILLDGASVKQAGTGEA